MKKVIGLIIGLLPYFANAECITSPDCYSIGYTETSCDGDSVKCPFDISKLYCVPCDSSFKYTCIGENIVSGIGNFCNNKYVACNCVAGAIFNNGECICNNSCDTIGNIYYSDGTCNSCKLHNKTAVGIIAFKNENKHLIISLENTQISWAETQYDDNNNIIISNHINLSQLTDYKTADTAQTDFEGKNNTQIIVNAYGENATGVAALYCYNYFPSGLENSKGQWYLPSLGELYNTLFYNQKVINKGLNVLEKNTIQNTKHWTSTELNHNSAWWASSTGIWNNDKFDVYSVYCFLAI